MKVGIIGTRWGRTHCGTFRDAGCEIAALLARQASEVERVAAEESVAVATTDPDALEACDVIVIASPTATHFHYLDRFRHKAIYCEKPLAPGPLSDDELTRFDGVHAFVNYPFLFLDSARALERQLDEPRFGPVRRILLDVGLHFPAHNTAIQRFHEVAVHPLSFLLHRFGAFELEQSWIGAGCANLATIFSNGEQQLDAALYWLPSIGLRIDLKIIGEGAVARLSGGFQPGRQWWFEPLLVDDEAVTDGEHSLDGDVWYRANRRAVAQFCAVLRGEIPLDDALSQGSFDLAKAAAMERMLAPLLSEVDPAGR